MRDDISLGCVCFDFCCGAALHCTEVRFTNLFSGGFITAIVVNPPERKLAKRTSVHCTAEYVI